MNEIDLPGKYGLDPLIKECEINRFLELKQ